MMKKFYGIFILVLMVQLSFAQKVSVPQLTSPTDTFGQAMPNAILDWVAVSGIGEITYHVQLATDADFTNLIVNDSTIAISAYTNYNLMFGQEYFWKVKAMDENLTSGWSEVYSFTIFTEVELKKPKDGDDEVDILALLTWEDQIEIDKAKIDIEGFDGYDIEMDLVDTFDGPNYTMMQTDGLAFEITTDYLLFGEVYYWRVRPMHADGFGPWSETRDFETFPMVELNKPNNNSTDQEFDIVLSWDALGEYDPDETDNDLFEYTLEVSTDEDFTEPLTIITLNDEAEPGFLKFGLEYWWRVKATTPNDVSPWSDDKKFTMIAAPELASPENEELVNTLSPTLEWETIEGAAGYEILLSKNADLSDPMINYSVDGDIDSYPLTELERNTFYYWSIKATRENDDSDYAETFMFNVINVGVEELTNISELNVFPNPATSTMALTFVAKESGNFNITISDILGKTISTQIVDVKTGMFNQNINIEGLNEGIYFLELNQNNESQVIRFLVK